MQKLLLDSGGAIRGGGGGEGGGRPSDSRFDTYGAPVHQVVNIYALFAKLCKHFILAMHF